MNDLSKLMKNTKPFRPTKQQLAAAVNQTVPDLIGPDLKVLFVGINPGLYSAATHRHLRGRGIASGRRCAMADLPMGSCRPSIHTSCLNSATASPTSAAARRTPRTS